MRRNGSMPWTFSEFVEDIAASALGGELTGETS